MTTLRPVPILANERGMALVMSLIALLVLSALVLAFSTLSSTEPTIANNHMRVAQARAAAEAGIERVAWALNNPTHGQGLDYTPSATAVFPNPVLPPYAGGTAITLWDGATQVGTFFVRALGGENPYRVEVRSVGWVPNNAKQTNPHQLVTATLIKPRDIVADAPCALCVRGDLVMKGKALVNASADKSCGTKPGVYTSGSVDVSDNASVRGTTWTEGTADNRLGSSAAGPFTGVDIVTPADPSNGSVTKPFKDNFDAFQFNDAELDMLRQIAKARGTYYQGDQTFNDPPNGIIFVDTVDGKRITAQTPESEHVEVAIHGNVDFSGWIIVNGSLHVSGNITINGLLFAADEFTYNGTGGGQIRGLAISGNVREQVSEVYDADDDATMTGNSRIELNCAFVRDGGTANGVPKSWMVQTGTYKEREGDQP